MTRLRLAFTAPLLTQRYPSRFTTTLYLSRWWGVQDSNLRPID